MKGLLLFVLMATLFFGCHAGEKKPPAGLLDSTVVVRYYGEDGKTVLELLEEKHQVKKKSSSVGSFVEEIDGLKNRSDRFWLYYVNGGKPNTASDRYTTAAGDTIEWRFEKEDKEAQ